MLIWRIETKCGIGFYRSASSEVKRIADDFQYGENNPLPVEDYPKNRKKSTLRDYVSDDRIFGFESLAAAKRWFNIPRSMDELDECFLVAYDSYRSVVKGRKQLVFVPTNPDRKAKFHPKELYRTSSRTLCNNARIQLRDIS